MAAKKQMTKDEVHVVVDRGNALLTAKDAAGDAVLYPNGLGANIDVVTEDGDLMATLPAAIVDFAIADGSLEALIATYPRLRRNALHQGKTIGCETAQADMRRALGMS